VDAESAAVVFELAKSKTGAGGGEALASELAKKLGMPPADGTGGRGPGTRENPGGTLEGAGVGIFGSSVETRTGAAGTSSVDETAEMLLVLAADSDAGTDGLNKGKGNAVGASFTPSETLDFYERNNRKSAQIKNLN
jgi:hypothetical protein